ncbi:MAG TPA: FABP family protein [Actinomycetota bacterium]
MTDPSTDLHAPGVDHLVVGPLVEAIDALSCLLGTWRGTGRGDYPTIDAFGYGEEMTFEHVGDGFLLSSQQSWLAHDGSPLHFERGFWRPGSAAHEVEVTLAHPLGLTEVAEGRIEVDGSATTTIDLVSVEVGRTRTGMDVVALERRYRVGRAVLRYEIDMRTGATPMTRHLTGELRRLDD